MLKDLFMFSKQNMKYKTKQTNENEKKNRIKSNKMK